MNKFKSITQHLSKKHIVFEKVLFSDTAISARTKDTSVDHNYNPANAIKTLVLTAKRGMIAVILRGGDTIDEEKAKSLFGKWSILNQNDLQEKFGFMPGTVCPLDIDLPIFIDENVLKLEIWSMGAGDVDKGINVVKGDVLRAIQHTIISIAACDRINSMDPIDELLTRGVDRIYPSREALEKVLLSGKKLRLYQGFDPTGIQLHIGHAVGFRKLRQWQDLGHHVIFLVGDGTGLAGDPSGKMKARGRFMSRKELRDNAKSYLMQASKIVRFDRDNPIEILYNGDWLTKLKLEDILEIAQNFTVQQMIERDMYQVRMKAGDSINLREFLYPLLQGYDSVAMNVDLEQGGSDQMFNMLAGRTLVKNMQGREKFVMTVPLLVDSKGDKIGKTEGNAIGLTDPPNEFFAKIMSLGDDAIIPCFTLLTDIPLKEIDAMKSQMKAGANPMTFKLQLAHHLTAWLNSKKAADSAQEDFGARFQKGELTHADIPVFKTKKSKWNPLDLLVETDLAASKSDARRLITQKAVEVDGKIIENTSITLTNGAIIKVGKKKLLKIKIL